MGPGPLLVGIALAPDSPWWLVRKGRNEDAKKSLLRLTSLNKETDFNADETIAMMVHTTALEDKVAIVHIFITFYLRLCRSPEEQVTGTVSRALICAGLK
jgi:hypothetical protein